VKAGSAKYRTVLANDPDVDATNGRVADNGDGVVDLVLGIAIGRANDTTLVPEEATLHAVHTHGDGTVLLDVGLDGLCVRGNHALALQKKVDMSAFLKKLARANLKEVRASQGGGILPASTRGLRINDRVGRLEGEGSLGGGEPVNGATQDKLIAEYSTSRKRR